MKGQEMLENLKADVNQMEKVYRQSWQRRLDRVIEKLTEEEIAQTLEPDVTVEERGVWLKTSERSKIIVDATAKIERLEKVLFDRVKAGLIC